MATPWEGVVKPKSLKPAPPSSSCALVAQVWPPSVDRSIELAPELVARTHVPPLGSAGAVPCDLRPHPAAATTKMAMSRRSDADSVAVMTIPTGPEVARH